MSAGDGTVSTPTDMLLLSTCRVMVTSKLELNVVILRQSHAAVEA